MTSRRSCEYVEQGNGPACKRCGRKPGSGEECVPGIFARLKQFAAAVAKHLADGMVEVDASIYASRLKACSECPRLTPDKVCSSCGCHVELKGLWRSEDCPEKRWPLEVETTPPPAGTAEGGCGCRKNR